MDVITKEELKQKAQEFSDAVKEWLASHSPEASRYGKPAEAYRDYISYWWAQHEAIRHRVDIIRLTQDINSIAISPDIGDQIVVHVMEGDLTRHIKVQRDYKNTCARIRRDWSEFGHLFDLADASAVKWLRIREEDHAVEP